AAIIEGDGEIELVVGGGAGLGAVDDFEDVFLEIFALADHAHAHAFARKPVEIARDVKAQEIEQRVHFFYGTAPILGREAKYGEVAHAQIAGGLDRAPQRLHALGVPKGAWAGALTRPAAVAVHDDSDVTGRVGRCG